jgi:hypothetical protein
MVGRLVGKVYLMTTLISNSVRMKETNFYLLTKIIASGLPYFDLSVDFSSVAFMVVKFSCSGDT